MQRRVLSVEKWVAQGQVGTVNAQDQLGDLIRWVRRPGRSATDLVAACKRPASDTQHEKCVTIRERLCIHPETADRLTLIYLVFVVKEAGID